MNKLSTNRMYRDLIRNRTLNGEFHIECIECGKLFVPESPKDRQFFIVSGVCLECKGC